MIRGQSAPYHWFDGDSIFVARRRRCRPQRRGAATGLPKGDGARRLDAAAAGRSRLSGLIITKKAQGRKQTDEPNEEGTASWRYSSSICRRTIWSAVSVMPWEFMSTRCGIRAAL